jgi:predicted HAD superfamily Cof-like phosphohydrolase
MEYSHPAQQDVADFHQAIGIPIGETPGIRRPELRASLIMEEAVETCEALTGRKVEWAYTGEDLSVGKRRRLVKAIDGFCDLLVVTYGSAVECGVDIGPFWTEVHESNMQKVGGPRRADGKQLKPPGWKPPDVEGVLLKMMVGNAT